MGMPITIRPSVLILSRNFVKQAVPNDILVATRIHITNPDKMVIAIFERELTSGPYLAQRFTNSVVLKKDKVYNDQPIESICSSGATHPTS